jgi:hypothetical protein
MDGSVPVCAPSLATVTGIAITSKFEFWQGAAYWIAGGTSTWMSVDRSELSHKL